MLREKTATATSAKNLHRDFVSRVGHSFNRKESVLLLYTLFKCDLELN